MLEMLSYLPSGSIAMFTIFVLISIGLCIFQIIMRKKYKLRTACKLSLFIPLIYSSIITFLGLFRLFGAIEMANDISPAIISSGLSISLISIILGLWITIFLFIFYSVTFVICDNLNK